MKFLALVSAVLLGSASLAAAAPSVQARDHRAPAARAPGAPVAFAPVAFAPRWTTLANDAQLHGRTKLDVDRTRRTFTKLELQSNRGRTTIDKVIIRFANGRTQTVKLGRVLAGQQALTIDLDGRARSLAQVVVIGQSGRRASIDVRAI